MKTPFLIAGLIICSISSGQNTREEDALARVFNLLNTENSSYKNEFFVTKEYLTKSAWEALSYLEESSDSLTVADLREAVPDFYHFHGKQVVVRLRQAGQPGFGMEMTIDYQVDGNHIKLFDSNGIMKDSWEILYLDDHYLALDMGGLRVFFTHAPQ